MDTLSLILSFIFGTIVGSFLNVVSLRFNSGAGLGGRSKCMSCGKKLTWGELIPIFSFLFQGGSCRKCMSKISWQYPLVEFFAGVVFVLIFFSFPPITPQAGLLTLLYILATCILVVISVYDIKHKIIPDPFVLAFGVIALATQFFGGYSWFHIPTLASLLAGPILALPFALLWLASKGTWMGLGDAKLVVGIGWMLGLGAGINSLILAFWIATIVSILWISLTMKRFKPKTEVPFGPYLIIAMYIVLLFDLRILDWSLIREMMASYI